MGDTWQTMCHNAWQRPMHVGHMAHGERYIWGVGVVRTSREQQEGKGRKKKREGKKGKKERKRKERKEEERERERRRKGKRCFDGRNSLDQKVKFVYSTRAALQEVDFLLLRFISRLGAV